MRNELGVHVSLDYVLSFILSPPPCPPPIRDALFLYRAVGRAVGQSVGRVSQHQHSPRSSHVSHISKPVLAVVLSTCCVFFLSSLLWEVQEDPFASVQCSLKEFSFHPN